MLIGIIVVGLLNAGLLFYLIARNQSKPDDIGTQMLKTDITELSKGVSELKDSLNEKIGEKLDKSQQHMTESIQRQFGQSAKIIAEITQRLTKLDETNKRVVDVADELKTLQNVLQNPKQRGGVGEYYLQTVLENILPPGNFKLQYGFNNGDIVDAAVFIDKKILPIDSKFSLENYNRLVETTDKSKRESLAKLFKQDLKNRIDETAKYIRPDERTMDFAFMFIPSEAIYYDLLINKVGTTNTSARDLLEYAFRDKKVIIVSPTTFMAYLQTVLQGLKGLQIEEQAKEIQLRVGQLGTHIGAYETFMQKLGSSLGTTVNHYNTAHKELKKIDKDIVKIAHSEPVIEPLLLDRPTVNED
ncbi:MAG: DNA recombination protein RmuC [Candidatus Saccharimonadales bacterium]